MRSLSRFVAAAAVLPTLGACVFADVTEPVTTVTTSAANTAVVGNTGGAFGYALQARAYSADTSYAPALTPSASSITVGLAVASYGGGTGRIQIADATGAVVYAAALEGTVAQGSTVVRGRAPYVVRLAFDHFSGSVSLGITPGA